MGVLSAGAQIDRYELVCPIGEGGMAEVWVAKQRGKHGFEKLFALKAMASRFADDPNFRAMFLDEARIVSAIEHPNVAQVFDLGESGSLLYLVMEYVDGESLGALLHAIAHRHGGRSVVPVDIALRVIAEACAGLHAAHRLVDPHGTLRGVVHRDVSPQNVLVGVRGNVKVIDFGIAHAKDRSAKATEASALKGKLSYMAPEHARRQPLGPHTDVFGAGATLYRLLAGHAPFDGPDHLAIISKIMSGEPPPPLPASVPPFVRAVVERALALDPAGRYGSAAEMQAALEDAIRQGGYRPDVRGWVNANLSERAQERRRLLGATSIPDLVIPAPAGADVSPHAPTAPRPATPTTTAPMPAAPARPGKDTGGPGFMDVRGLVAARGNAPEPAPPPPGAVERRGRDLDEPTGGGAPTPELGAEPTAAVLARTQAERDRAARKRSLTKLAIALVALAFLAAAVIVLVPMVVRDRIIATGREIGVELSFEDLRVGLSGITLRDVTAKSARVPTLGLHADEVFLSGLSGKRIRVTAPDLKLSGGSKDTTDSLLLLANDVRQHLGKTAGESRHVSLVGARLAWIDAFGPGSRVTASDAGLELDTRGGGSEDVRGSVGRVEVTTSKTTFGPWASSFETNPSSSRFRLLFDPPVPDGPSVLYVWGPSTTTQLTVRIPRTAIANLGIKPADLGWPADASTELDVKIDGSVTNGRVEGSGHVDLYGARLQGTKAPIDIKAEGGASGAAGKPLDLDKTQVTAGPFVALVQGTLAPKGLFGLRVDATWRTVPVPCSKLARAEAKTLGPVAAAIAGAMQEVAQKTGALRITGNASASGLVTYDTDAPDEISGSIETKDTCGISIFGL